MITRLFTTLRFLLSTGGAWVDGEDWSNEDRGELAHYLSTPSGRTLIAKLRNSSLSLNHQAVQKGEPHGCGVAAGYALALTDIQTLSVTGSPQESEHNEESAETGNGNLEQLNP